MQKVIAKPGTWVKKGDPLLEIYDRDIATDVRVLEARLQELEARRREQVVTDRVKAQILDEGGRPLQAGTREGTLRGAHRDREGRGTIRPSAC